MHEDLISAVYHTQVACIYKYKCTYLTMLKSGIISELFKGFNFEFQELTMLF